MKLRKYYLLIKFKIINFLRHKAKWLSNDKEIGFKSRIYSDYEEYINHQKSKLTIIRDVSMEEYERNYFDALKQRLSEWGKLEKGSRVLCIAARLGAEVRAFIELGCFAVGMDLNPGEGNRYVVSGDFHNIQWSEDTVDIVFSNSLDHVYDFDKVMGEVSKILRVKGLLIVEAMMGVTEGTETGYWESFAWDTVAELINKIESYGFEITYESEFKFPWKGKMLIFVKK